MQPSWSCEMVWCPWRFYRLYSALGIITEFTGCGVPLIIFYWWWGSLGIIFHPETHRNKHIIHDQVWGDGRCSGECVVVGLKPSPRIRVESFCHILVVWVNTVHIQCVLNEQRSRLHRMCTEWTTVKVAQNVYQMNNGQGCTECVLNEDVNLSNSMDIPKSTRQKDIFWI